jgi:DNA-binding NarL/FixJ family response regulator/bacterioferritin-associated ferredoxin
MYRVVLIDDEKIIVEGLRRIIPWDTYGCQVVGTASDAEEGAQMIRTLQPQILFTDIRMPGADGLTMLAGLRSEFPDMQVTVLTGYRDFAYAQEAIRLGVTRFLVKPSKMDELKEAVAAMVNRLDRLAPEEPVQQPQSAGSFIVNQAMRSTGKFQLREAIRNFCGVRAHSDNPDFIIGAVDGVPGFFNLAGIKSPGLTSAPAIGEDMINILAESGYTFEPKSEVVETREVVVFHNLSHEERAELVKKNPLYGRIICRCETITEGEIVDALHRPLPPRTIDGIKRRCGSGLGRCQGGFCGPRVQEIISRELGIPYMSIEKDKTGSYILYAETKQGGAK